MVVWSGKGLVAVGLVFAFSCFCIGGVLFQLFEPPSNGSTPVDRTLPTAIAAAVVGTPLTWLAGFMLNYGCSYGHGRSCPYGHSRHWHNDHTLYYIPVQWWALAYPLVLSAVIGYYVAQETSVAVGWTVFGVGAGVVLAVPLIPYLSFRFLPDLSRGYRDYRSRRQVYKRFEETKRGQGALRRP